MPKKKMRDDKNICGPRMKKRRVELGLTQGQLAARMELLGVMWDQKIISRVELQMRAIFDFELLAVTKALEIEERINSLK